MQETFLRGGNPCRKCLCVGKIDWHYVIIHTTEKNANLFMGNSCPFCKNVIFCLEFKEFENKLKIPQSNLAQIIKVSISALFDSKEIENREIFASVFLEPSYFPSALESLLYFFKNWI